MVEGENIDEVTILLPEDKIQVFIHLYFILKHSDIVDLEDLYDIHS